MRALFIVSFAIALASCAALQTGADPEPASKATTETVNGIQDESPKSRYGLKNRQPPLLKE